MDRIIKVTINGQEREVEKGITLYDLSKEYQSQYPYDIILAFVDHKLCELFKRVEQDCVLRFVTTGEDVGYRSYVRGLTLVMIKSIYGVLGADIVEKVSVEYTVGNGLFCQIKMEGELTQEICEKIKEKMTAVIEGDFPFTKRTIGSQDAIDLFNQYGMYDKEKLFKYRRVSKTNIYNLEGFEDYHYGYMPPSTGMLAYFDFFTYKDGVMLLLPNKISPNRVDAFVPQPKLFQCLSESNQWAEMMGIHTVGALNDVIVNGGINDLILTQEALQEAKIGEIAAKIKESGKKFVMIAGPSSSGKTTFSHRLSIQLKAHGLIPHPIAIDNYFVERDRTPLDEFGKPNFECLEAIDLESFNQDMTCLLEGKTVDMPVFNFKSGAREYKGDYKTLGPKDILVIEGIHGLNDRLSYSLPKESKFKIYISALTSLNIDEHNRIPTTDVRLLRRMVRDARTRGASGTRTIDMWPSVRRGENENIFPFQEEADVMFNSALIYELAVLKQYAEPVLFEIDRDLPEYVEAKRLLKFLDYFLGVGSEMVPQNSILKEFVGGGCFKV